MSLKIIRLFYCFALPFIFLGATSAVSEENPIKIAAMIHITGEYAEAGSAFLEGLTLAEEEIAAQGKVKGRSIKVIIDDTRYDMKLVNTLSHKALSVDNAVLGLISNYTEVMVAGPVFERARIPLITLWDSSPEIEALGEYVFGIGVWTPSSSQVSAEYALNKIGAETAVTIANNGQWSIAVADSFEKNFSAGGGRVLKKFVVNPQDTDFRTLIAQIVRLNPDLVYAPLSDNPLAFWKQLGTSAYRGARISSDTITQEIVNQLGEVANGILTTQLIDPSGLRTDHMLHLYREKFKRECTQLFLVGLGYDALHLAVEALRRAESLSGPDIARAIYSLRDFPGAAGEISVTPQGSVIKPASMFVVRNGRLTALE